MLVIVAAGGCAVVKDLAVESWQWNCSRKWGKVQLYACSCPFYAYLLSALDDSLGKRRNPVACHPFGGDKLSTTWFCAGDTRRHRWRCRCGRSQRGKIAPSHRGMGASRAERIVAKVWSPEQDASWRTDIVVSSAANRSANWSASFSAFPPTTC